MFDHDDSLTENIMIGKGNTAEVFEYESGKVCKLFFSGYPAEYVGHEYQNAKEAFRQGLNIPEPFGVVTMNQRNGIVYEKVDGELLLSCGGHTNADELLDIFTKIHKEWLSCRSRNLLSYKKYFSIMLQDKGAECKDLMEEIYALPEGNCILHGDFHPDNVLVRSSDGKPVVIDFMNMCYGPALYDVARTFFLLNQIDRSMAKIYLKKMKVREIDIEKYVTIIERCREYEI